MLVAPQGTAAQEVILKDIIHTSMNTEYILSQPVWVHRTIPNITFFFVYIYTDLA